MWTKNKSKSVIINKINPWYIKVPEVKKNNNTQLVSRFEVFWYFKYPFNKSPKASS